MVVQVEEYRDQVSQEQFFKPRLYTYPDVTQSVAVFDDEELVPNQLLVLCVRANPDKDILKNSLYIWTGEEFESSSEMTPKQFVEQVAIHYWGEDLPKLDVDRVEEEAGDESDEFMHFFLY